MNKDKELEEAIKTLKIIANKSDQPFKFSIETVLQALDEEKYFNKIHSYHMKYNFIPKKKIEEVLEDYKERKRYYEDENIEKDNEYFRIQGIIEVLEEILEVQKKK